MEDGPMQVVPGRSVGFMTLGSSLHEVLTTIKAEVKAFPSIHFTHDGKRPVSQPIHVGLPENGLRLQFDGPDQRLRLIEVLDFRKAKLVYKDMELLKPTDGSGDSTGPSFKYVYDKLLGPTYPGEYLPPKPPRPLAMGTYNLSYPGIAFNFPVRHSAYVPNSTKVLSSAVTKPATSMAVFSGESWQKARGALFTSTPAGPRAPSLAAKNKEGFPDEIELVRIHDQGRIELVRRSSSPFWIVLSETTPQDLIMELGPPDSIYKKSDHRLSIHKERRASDASDTSPDLADTDSHRGSDNAWEDHESDEETAEAAQEREVAEAEHFYNYFYHGFDLLISQPTKLSPAVPAPWCKEHEGGEDGELTAQPGNHLTVTKVIFHGNVPGSYQFNRHRRSRWTLEHFRAGKNKVPLNSEMPFEELAVHLKNTFKYPTYYKNEEEQRLQQRGMALNRGWADSPSSSTELLGSLEDSSGKKSGSANAGSGFIQDDSEVGNVELFGFPGLIFEVLKNGSVSVLTVY